MVNVLNYPVCKSDPTSKATNDDILLGNDL